jgi:hypothetical protein
VPARGRADARASTTLHGRGGELLDVLVPGRGAREEPQPSVSPAMHRAMSQAEPVPPQLRLLAARPAQAPVTRNRAGLVTVRSGRPKGRAVPLYCARRGPMIIRRSDHYELGVVGAIVPPTRPPQQNPACL